MWRRLLPFVLLSAAVAVGVAVGPWLRPYVPATASYLWLAVRAVAVLAVFGFVVGLLRVLVWQPIWRRVWDWMHADGTSDHPWR
jgi:hypothetical protein